MAVYSYIRSAIDLERIEIEVSLVPGIPHFQIVGMPDAAIKESLWRIKSALRSCGYQLPQKEQVLINLKPAYEKKISQGLDLAIAFAYLLKTEQLQLQQKNDIQNFYCYGELSLTGEVLTPEDIDLIECEPSDGWILTGANRPFLSIYHGEVKTLNDLQQINWREANVHQTPIPTTSHDHVTDLKFSESTAKLLTIISAGEHNTFVAGPAGTGKTTFCQVLHSLLREPSVEQFKKIHKIGKITGQPYVGRPFISPHHSTSEIALLGGGVPPQPGEITRAHHGLLVMDEFLEYSTYVKEAMREPIERHEIVISRAGGHRLTLPADFLLVATSNLCPCGDYVPGEATSCGYYSFHCKSYFRKLNGPMIDRFEILTFSHKWQGDKNISFADINNRVRAAQNFAINSRGQKIVNARLSLKDFDSLIDPFTRTHLMPELPASQRRVLALLRVARTLADLDEAPLVMGRHIQASRQLTLQPFVSLKQSWF